MIDGSRSLSFTRLPLPLLLKPPCYGLLTSAALPCVAHTPRAGLQVKSCIIMSELLQQVGGSEQNVAP